MTTSCETENRKEKRDRMNIIKIDNGYICSHEDKGSLRYLEGRIMSYKTIDEALAFIKGYFTTE